MTMTNQEEEAFILNEYLSARHELELVETQIRNLRTRKNHLEALKEETKQAMIDYMVGNGVEQTTINHLKVSVSKTYSVDVPDVEAVPEEFLRIKVMKEPNKLLIKEARPDANWWSMKESYKLTVE